MLNKEQFKLSTEQEFCKYRKSFTYQKSYFDKPLQDIKNRIVKTHGINNKIIYATQRYEEGNNKLYLINGYRHQFGAYEASNNKGVLVPDTEDFVRGRD